MRDRRHAPFFWIAVTEMAAIRLCFEKEQRRTAIAIYATLVELANEARSSSFTATRTEVAERAGVTPKTLGDYVPDLVATGVLSVGENDGWKKPSTWELHSVDDDRKSLPNGASHDGKSLPNDDGKSLPNSIQEENPQEEHLVPAGGSDRLFSVPEEDQTAVGQEPTEAEREEAIVATVFARWVALTNPANKTLSPSRRRLISRAAKEAPVAILLQSLEGLVKWSEQKADGNTQLSRVFQTYPGGKPLSEQIEFFASQASGASGSSAFPSVDRAKLRDVKQALIIARSMPENELAQRRAESAVEWLGAHGLTHRFDGAAIVIEQTVGPVA